MDVMTCQEKKKYRNLFIAEWAMDEVKQRYGEDKYPYHCTLCDAFHLTSTKPLGFKREFPINTIMSQGRLALLVRHSKWLMVENEKLKMELEKEKEQHEQTKTSLWFYKKKKS
jgi:hypothetical protein